MNKKALKQGFFIEVNEMVGRSISHDFPDLSAAWQAELNVGNNYLINIRQAAVGEFKTNKVLPCTKLIVMFFL